MKTLTFFFLVMLSGCSILQKNTLPNNDIELGDPKLHSIKYTITAPPKNFFDTTHNHIIEISYQKQRHKFIAQVEYSENKIAVAAVSPAGIALFDFVWQKNSPIQLNQYIPIPHLNINHIIADIQWVNWPLEQLQSSFDNSTASLTQRVNPESDKNSDWLRLLTIDNEPILKVSKQGNVYFLKNILKQYSIKIIDLGAEI